jgi:hypothetical protein
MCNNSYEPSLEDSQSVKYLTYISSVCPHENSEEVYLYLSDKESRVQRGEEVAQSHTGLEMENRLA